MRALSMGTLARKALDEHWPAQVIGVTSGGVFIIAQGDWVLFLTYSPFRAPGTINLERSAVDLKENENGSRVELEKNRIVFPETGLLINVDGALTWDGRKKPEIGAELKAGIAGRLRRVVTAASAGKGSEGLAPALRWLVGEGDAQITGDVTEKVIAGLNEMRIAISTGLPDRLIAAASAIIGHGRGLTPAADDAIAGVLLALNRWKEVLEIKFDLMAVNEALVKLARAKTTSLSATLIHAAACGQADERILSVLDGIISGDFDEKKAVHDLIQMGHSSGVDSLVGITLVLTA